MQLHKIIFLTLSLITSPIVFCENNVPSNNEEPAVYGENIYTIKVSRPALKEIQKMNSNFQQLNTNLEHLTPKVDEHLGKTQEALANAIEHATQTLPKNILCAGSGISATILLAYCVKQVLDIKADNANKKDTNPYIWGIGTATVWTVASFLFMYRHDISKWFTKKS